MVSATLERARSCLFLLTDYGTSDEFAGILKSVLARLAPDAPVVDLTHGIPRFDVRAGALCLVRCAGHLGPGVLMGVVDPGVGSARRAIAIEVRSDSGPRSLVGPDNGLLIWVAEALGGIEGAVELERRGSGTFDGRDLFAPVSAALWRGARITDIGKSVDRDGLVRLPAPMLTVGRGVLEAEVLWVDTFGNAQLSAGPADADLADLGDPVSLEAGGERRTVRRARSFESVAAGEIGLIVDSNGHLALAGDRTSAALTLGLGEADPVTLRSIGESS